MQQRGNMLLEIK